MTDVAVLVDPPRAGLVAQGLAAATPLSEDEAVDLYAASVKDTALAVAASGGELLVNYRPEETIPEAHRREEGVAEETVRTMITEALAAADHDADEVRFEPQVGSSFSARAGNTVTHLLEEEDATSAAVTRGLVPLIERTHVDNAAMKLRRSEVVLGPTPGGSVGYAGFAETVDFENAFTEPALETLTDRGVDTGHDVDYVPMLPRVDTPDGLATLVSTMRARARADRSVPHFTTGLVDDFGLYVASRDGETELVTK